MTRNFRRLLLWTLGLAPARLSWDNFVDRHHTRELFTPSPMFELKSGPVFCVLLFRTIIVFYVHFFVGMSTSFVLDSFVLMPSLLEISVGIGYLEHIL